MAKLEIQLGADSAELLKELSASEAMLKNWVTKLGSFRPKFSSSGLAEYSKETNKALEAEAIALAKATTETQNFKAAQAAAAAEIAKFRNEKNTSSKAITENSRLYKQLSQRLTEVRKNAQDVGAQFGVNSTQFAKASEAVQRLDGRLKSIDSALGVNTRRVGAYGNALQSSNSISIEFARIIQDAPFGIIGVGNNITQLTSNYAQYAQGVRAAAAEQGKQVTSGSILKGALQGLLTPASLLTLGISAITTGLTLYTMWSQRSAKASRDAAKEAKKAGDDYVSSLDQVTQARLKGEQSAQGELTSLRALYKVYTDGNAPIATRREAYTQLQQIYPDYFKNIAFEQSASEKTKKAYDELTNSILASARARAATDLITKNATRQLENQQKIVDLQLQLEKERLSIAKQIARAGNQRAIGSAGIGAGGGQGISSLREASENRQNDIIQQQNNLRTDSNVLQERSLNLEKEITKEIEKGAKISSGGVGKSGSSETKLSEAQKTAKAIADVYKGLNAELASSPFGLDRNILNVAKDDVKAYEKALDSLIKLGVNPTSDAIQKLQANITDLGSVINSNKLGDRIGFKPISTNLKVNADIKNPFKNQTAAQEDDAYLQRAIRSSLTSFVNDSIGAITSIGQKNYDIEKKYADLRKDATSEQIALYTEMERLEKSVSTGLLSTITTVFGSLTKGINDIFVKGFSDKISKSISSGDFKLGKGISTEVSQALVAGAGLAGGLISGISSPTSKAGQGIGGALSGAATGAALGSVIPGLGTLVGAIGGGLLGAIGGIFGASKAKKQEELQRQQVELQKKQLEEQKRANALAYTSSIIGQMTNQGVVTGIDRDAYGNIVGKIEGKDLLLIIDRTQKSR